MIRILIDQGTVERASTQVTRIVTYWFFWSHFAGLNEFLGMLSYSTNNCILSRKINKLNNHTHPIG